MNTGTGRFWILSAVVALALACGLKKMHRDSTLLEAARQESAALRAQIDVRDQTISDLNAKTLNQSILEPTIPLPSSAGSADALALLSHRLDQLAFQQANILTLVQRLASKDGPSELPEPKPLEWQKAIDSLDARAASRQDNLNAAKRKIDHLALNLQVPDEVAMTDPAEALDIPGLKKYWPYFQARRERDEIQRFITILKMKAVSEELDFKADAAKRLQQ
jgi:hypothetical protein